MYRLERCLLPNLRLDTCNNTYTMSQACNVMLAVTKQFNYHRAACVLLADASVPWHLQHMCIHSVAVKEPKFHAAAIMDVCLPLVLTVAQAYLRESACALSSSSLVCCQCICLCHILQQIL